MRTKLLIATLLFIFSFANHTLATIEDNINETFRVDKGGILTIQADLGAIRVTTHDQNSIKVLVVRKLDTNSRREADRLLQDLTIDFDQSGNDLTITADMDDEGWSFWKKFRRKIRLEFVITVPREYNVNLNTSGGSISVDDLIGSVIARSSGGSLKFGDIEGPVDGKTSGGSVTLESCSGDASVKTSGGSLNIGDVKGNVIAKTSGGSINIGYARGQVDASTSGGSITVRELLGDISARTSGGTISVSVLQQPEGACSLSTSGGSIHANFFEDIRISVDARTSGGRVRTDFPVLVQGELKKNSLKADINGGGPLLKLRTSGGNININKL